MVHATARHVEPTGVVAEGLEPDWKACHGLQHVQIIHEVDEVARGLGRGNSQDTQSRQEVQEESSLDTLGQCVIRKADAGKGC